jgi:hypothetical protein
MVRRYFHENNIKKKLMFSEFTLGYIQTSGEWPFTTHFFTENQLDTFIASCKRNKYSHLHIDATGSIVKKLRDQKAIYFYSMVYKDEYTGSSILPLSGALLSDHSTAAITAYFYCVISKIASRNKTARPSFIVIDFSHALLNSTLAAFNVENIHSHLRRCSNTLDYAYTAAQLKSMTFVRLCCAHVMKAFARSVNKIETSKEARRQLMLLFGILLESKNVDGAFGLYEQIMNIYADPQAENSSRILNSLLSTTDLIDDDIDKYLNEQMDDVNEPNFFDEIDITKDAIIYQSPFNIKACARVPALNKIIQQEKYDGPITNSLYSRKIVQLFHKWFAYLPLWSCIMTDFVDEQCFKIFYPIANLRFDLLAIHIIFYI